MGRGAIWWPDAGYPTPASNEELFAFMRGLQGEGFWYVASPYSKYPAGREQAFIDASKFGAKLINEGIKVFVPIPHSHPIAVYGTVRADDHDTWLAQDKAIAQFACGIAMIGMPGLDESTGVTREREWFRSWNKPEIRLWWEKELANDEAKAVREILG